MYKKSEVEKNTLEYFSGDTLATSVWIDKYCLKNNKGEYLELTPDDMHKRLAKEFARIEQKYKNPLSYEEIYNYFKNFKYIVPQGRIMAGLGAKETFKSLSNCLVLPTPLDSYNSIMRTDTMLVSAAKRGCGFGIDLSNLRAKGSPTRNASITSTGIIPFMERYSNSTREVGQDSRRGACLLGLDIKHPQIEDFITVKSDLSKITGANVSVKIDDEFMGWITSSDKDIENDHSNLKYYINKDKTLWNKLIHQAWKSAEPGIFYWDRINNYDPVSVYKNHKITLTNACGEQPMSEFDTCRLIVLNLYSYVENPFTSKAKFNFDKFYKHSKILTRLGDDLVDLEIEYIDRILNKIKSDPEPNSEKQIELELWNNIKNKAITGRRIGGGITGLGDMLAALNMPYNFDISKDIIKKVFKTKFRGELTSSIQLAKERGAFPDYDVKKEHNLHGQGNDFYTMIVEEFPDLAGKPRRNINWSTIAPTGTTSLMTQTTSGCEPCYQLSHKRRRKIDKNRAQVIPHFQDQNGDLWEEYIVLHPKFKEWINYTYGADIVSTGIGEKELQWWIEKSPWNKSTAYEIDPLQRVKIQALLQKYTTSAISSTINLPESATEEEVSNIYTEAWKQGCKGITIYRNNCRTGVLVSNTESIDEIKQTTAPKRPKSIKGEAFHTNVKGEMFTVVIGLLNNSPYEIFAYKGNSLKGLGEIVKKKRGEYIFIQEDNKFEITNNLTDEQEAITRGYSFGLRHGGDVKFAMEQLNKTKGNLTDFSKAIARCLKKFVKDGEKASGVSCDTCGSSNIIYVGGCSECKDCGNSRCN